MAPSIRDIAARAGVATSTVSRVINGSPRYRISDETAQRVWQAVRELDYKVDHVARQTVRRRWYGDKTRGGLYRIGIVHPGFGDSWAASFHYDVLLGVQAELLQRRMVMAGMFEAAQLLDPVALFHATDPTELDGLILLGAIPAELQQPLAQRVKAIVSAPATLETIDSIDFDHRHAVMTMVQHLAGIGHRKIAYIGQFQPCGKLHCSHQRAVAFRETMAQLNLPTPQEYLIEGCGGEQGAFQASFERFMAIRERPSALVCCSDRSCIEMMRRMLRAGLRVPQDVALTGFEDLEVAAMMVPGITTMRAPRGELGRQAVDMLVRRIEQPQTPIEHRVLPTQLVVRESCGAASLETPA